MIKINKKSDERQEAELMKIGDFSFWVVLFTLFFLIIIQLIFYNATFKEIIGEVIGLLVGCASLIYGCILKGQWCNFTHPTAKVYLLSSSIASIISFIISIIRMYVSKGMIFESLLLLASIKAIIVFVLALILISATGVVIKNRQLKLEQKYKD